MLNGTPSNRVQAAGDCWFDLGPTEVSVAGDCQLDLGPNEVFQPSRGDPCCGGLSPALTRSAGERGAYRAQLCSDSLPPQQGPGIRPSRTDLSPRPQALRM